MSLSIREHIMQTIQTAFEGMQSGVNNYNTTWHQIYRSPVPEDEQILINALGIYSSDEQLDRDVGTSRRMLSVNFEFYYRHQYGEAIETQLNSMLVDIQRLVESHYNWSDYVLDSIEEGNEFFYEVKEGISMGLITYTIHYRHLSGDPLVQP